MKTFFLALILGIFVGSIITNYFANPDAYERLKEAKARLSGQSEYAAAPEQAEATETEEPQAPARFEVGSGEYKGEAAAIEKTAEPKPLPPPEAKSEAKVETPPAAKPEGETSEPAKPLPSPKTTPSTKKELIDEGVKKAEEIVEDVTEKAKEVAEDAKPLIEEGIDFTIAAAIRAQYKLEHRIDSSTIKISVKDNIVTLSGTVDSEATKQLAIEIAVFTRGVNGVEESLSIAE